MEIRFSEEEEAFRHELRSYIEAEFPDRSRLDRDLSAVGMTRPEWELAHAFDQKLAERGWLCMHWPKEYGGQDASLMKQIVYQEVMGELGVPTASGMTVNIVAPAIMVHGTDEQKTRLLPDIASAKAVWCQGFSEPDAGSDLASLTTTARKTDGGYVLTGTKLWSSGAAYADFGWVLARTDPGVPKHRGLSTFAVDMRTPGITVRPLRNIVRSNHFCEIHFDEALVPSSALVGVENRGWYQAMTTLSFERSGISRIASLHRVLQQFIDYVRATGQGRDPLVRQQIADLAVDLEAARMLCYRVAWMQSRNEVPGSEASVSRVFGAELSQKFGRVGMDLMGLDGALIDETQGAPMEGLASRRALASLAHTLMAGTSEIQRNIIAQRGLGLPKTTTE